ncbi:MAG: hypothetical protein CME61_06420 [Halobacteriovoraceae bacterium]|nr:hypothetical protein [Halobacteriovoraceae bacterium]|tara:strand:+ start:204 stop:392 length:189 start_codon:yes stop_codon:yes gene_type:complete
MSLSDALKEKVMDVRLRDKLLAEGKITKEELESYISNLSDDTQNSQPLYPETEEEQSSEAQS